MFSNREQTIFIDRGQEYNDIFYGQGATDEHFKENGWYKINTVYEPLSEYQVQGTPTTDIDDNNLEININYPAVNLTQAEIEDKQRAEFKANRQLLLNNLEITYNNIIYQADEISQSRMARAIVGMSDTDVITWIAKDNSSHQLTKSDLQNMLTLCGQAQIAIWYQ